MNEQVCAERHKAVDRTLAEHGELLKSHDEKIGELTTSDARNTTQIDNLVKSISNQTKAIWGLVMAVLATLAGFFVWYVQTLAR
jgi:hypothetical protein